MSCVRITATVRGDVGERDVVDRNCSSYIPSISQRSNASDTSTGTVRILADDGDPRSCRRGGDHREDLLSRIVDVGTLVRRESLRHPPQPFDRHGVVDAQDVGMSPDPCDQLAPQAVTTCIAAGSGGGNPQSWPSPKNASGGAPTLIPRANIDGSAHTS